MQTIDKLYGKYGVYEIKRKSGIFSDSYYIYKDGKSWKSANSPAGARRIIKKYDPDAE